MSVRRALVQAVVSGLAIGLGAAVLLQQFAVVPLTLVTGVLLPIGLGALGAGAVLVRRRAVRR